MHRYTVQLLGNVYTLAVSNTLTLLGNQNKSLFCKKKKKCKWSGQIYRFTSLLWHISRRDDSEAQPSS